MSWGNATEESEKTKTGSEGQLHTARGRDRTTYTEQEGKMRKKTETGKGNKRATTTKGSMKKEKGERATQPPQKGWRKE